MCISVLERVQDQHPQTLEEKKKLCGKKLVKVKLTWKKALPRISSWTSKKMFLKSFLETILDPLIRCCTLSLFSPVRKKSALRSSEANVDSENNGF